MIIKRVAISKPKDDLNLSSSRVNQCNSSVAIVNNKITVSTDTYRNKSYKASYQDKYVDTPYQWVGLLLNLGSTITDFSLNGRKLTENDIQESLSVGGSINQVVLWVRSEIIKYIPRKIEISKGTYGETYFIFAENVGLPQFAYEAQVVDDVDKYATGIPSGNNSYSGGCGCSGGGGTTTDIDWINGGSAFSD